MDSENRTSMGKASKMVSIYFSGKEYKVPQSFTIMQAYELVGHQYTRGCGCRGGACGACGSLYIIPGVAKLNVGLACQTQVVSGMSVIQIPYFPVKKERYKLEEAAPNTLSICNIYPKLLECMGCNTCTKMCPQEINVMECMSAVFRGDIKNAAIQSMSCVMCGLCAARCPAEIAPYNIMLLCRRLYGKYLQKQYTNLSLRLDQIKNGEFDSRLDELMKLPIDKLKIIYEKQQADKRMI